MEFREVMTAADKRAEATGEHWLDAVHHVSDEAILKDAEARAAKPGTSRWGEEVVVNTSQG